MLDNSTILKPAKWDDSVRYNVYRTIAHGSWWTSFTLLILRTTDVISQGAAPWLGLLIVMFIGTGIAGGLALSRMRLAETITGVFETGLRAATALQANIVGSVAVVEVDTEGIIESAEHPEVIHWERGELEGRPLEDLIPDRFLRAHRAGFEKFRETGESRVSGATLNIPVLAQDGSEHIMRLTVARLGDTFIGTLVPVGIEE